MWRVGRPWNHPHCRGPPLSGSTGSRFPGRQDTHTHTHGPVASPSTPAQNTHTHTHTGSPGQPLHPSPTTLPTRDDQVWLEGGNLLAGTLHPLLLHLQQRGPAAARRGRGRRHGGRGGADASMVPVRRLGWAVPKSHALGGHTHTYTYTAAREAHPSAHKTTHHDTHTHTRDTQQPPLTSPPPSSAPHWSGSPPSCTPAGSPAAGCVGCGSCCSAGRGRAQAQEQARWVTQGGAGPKGRKRKLMGEKT